MLPSLVSRMAPTQLRGAAMGVYSSSQFLGVFFGGISAGWLFGIYGVNGVIWLCATIVGIWFMLVIRSRDFSLTRTISLHFSDEQQENVEFRLEELRSLRGVVDVTFIPTYAVAYLRIRAEEFDRQSIDGYAQK